MKLITRIIITFVALVMLFLTSVSYWKDFQLLFTNESALYLSSISEVNYFSSWCFFLVYLVVAVFRYRTINVIKISALSILFVLWLMSGRVIAFKPFPDGRIITGYYYIETSRFDLCTNENDCESLIAKEKSIQQVPLWRVKFERKQIEKVIFIGPFTWQQCNDVFKNLVVVTEKRE